jgi:hypothetical protein
MSLIAIFFLLNACTTKQKSLNHFNSESSNNPKAVNVWYVTKKEKENTLVVNVIPKDTGGVKEFYDAVWVSNIPDEVEIGQKVEVLFEGAMAASYPGQGRAKKVSILPKIKPNKANMTEDQVIREALTSKETSNINIFVIKDIKFDEKLDLWTIRFKDGVISDKETEQRNLQILDK